MSKHKLKHQDLMEDLFFRTNCAHLQAQVLQFLKACQSAGIKTIEQALNEVQAYVDEQNEIVMRENAEYIKKNEENFKKP